jgi:UDP-glucose 4-epimerase
VDDLSTGALANLARVHSRIEFVRGDLCDTEVCRQAVAGVDVVFHLAALASVPLSLADPWASHAANVNGTMRLLQACADAKVRRIVYSSSSAVYGDTVAGARSEGCEPLPRSPYATSKLAGEQYVLAFARAGVVEGVALRYFNVFGPRQSPNSAYAAVIPNFLQAALLRRRAAIYGDGGQTRDFVYVENVVDANILAASAPAEDVSGWVLNVGAGQSTSLLALLQMIGSVTGRALEYSVCPPRPGDVRDSLADLNRARRLLGYRARVPLEEGLRRTWQHLADMTPVSAAARISQPTPQLA